MSERATQEYFGTDRLAYLAELKRKIDEGTYDVAPEMLADSLIRRFSLGTGRGRMSSASDCVFPNFISGAPWC